jgi:hypothetical protein
MKRQPGEAFRAAGPRPPLPCSWSISIADSPQTVRPAESHGVTPLDATVAVGACEWFLAVGLSATRLRARSRV